MNKFRMVEYTMSDGGKQYGIEKKGWFGWRVKKIAYYGLYRKTVYNKSLVEFELRALNESHLHIVSKKEI